MQFSKMHDLYEFVSKKRLGHLRCIVPSNWQLRSPPDSRTLWRYIRSPAGTTATNENRHPLRSKSMTSRNLCGRGVLALLLIFMAVPVWAESPLAVVPASSPIVIQVHGLDRTKDRLIATLTSALPDLGQMANFALNAGLQNLPE